MLVKNIKYKLRIVGVNQLISYFCTRNSKILICNYHNYEHIR